MPEPHHPAKRPMASIDATELGEPARKKIRAENSIEMVENILRLPSSSLLPTISGHSSTEEDPERDPPISRSSSPTSMNSPKLTALDKGKQKMIAPPVDEEASGSTLGVEVAGTSVADLSTPSESKAAPVEEKPVDESIARNAKLVGDLEAELRYVLCAWSRVRGAVSCNSQRRRYRRLHSCGCCAGLVYRVGSCAYSSVECALTLYLCLLI